MGEAEAGRDGAKARRRRGHGKASKRIGPGARAELAGQVEAALARATIHLNLNEPEAAGRDVIEAIEADPDFQVFLPYTGWGKEKTTGHAFMPPGQAFYSPQHGLLVLHQQIWRDYLLRGAFRRFAAAAARSTEPTWIAYSRADFDLLDETGIDWGKRFGDGW